MPRQFKTARLIKQFKVSEATILLGVSQPTLSAWEGERKSPSLEKLELMAEVYDVSTDYLLGRTDASCIAPSNIVAPQSLLILHGKPVWSAIHGWMLVNTIKRQLIISDGTTIPFADAGELYTTPPMFSESPVPYEAPFTKDELLSQSELWVEPISVDPILRNELRGWYHLKERFVENEYGNRLYLDSYGVRWLGYKTNL